LACDASNEQATERIVFVSFKSALATLFPLMRHHDIVGNMRAARFESFAELESLLVGHIPLQGYGREDSSREWAGADSKMMAFSRERVHQSARGQ